MSGREPDIGCIGSTVTTSVTTPSGEFLGFKRGSSYYWYLKDAIGSIVGVMDNSGIVVNTYSYDPYGTILTSSETSGAEQPFRFAGAYYDADLTLYKMGARYYDPRIGRFLQPDPMGMDPMRPQTWDLYAYAGNDPINRVDASAIWPDLRGVRSRAWNRMPRRTCGWAVASLAQVLQLQEPFRQPGGVFWTV